MDFCKYCGGEIEIRTLNNGEDVYYCPACKRGWKIPSKIIEPANAQVNNAATVPKPQDQSASNNGHQVQNTVAKPLAQVGQPISSDRDELKECIEDIIIAIDESSVYNMEFYKLLQAIVEKSQKHYNNLALTERAEFSLFYDGMIAIINNLKQFYNLGSMGKANIDATVPTIKTQAMNVYAKLS